jgi:alpha-galactosidase
VAEQHPEWIILDASGKRGRIQDLGNLAALCPAVPGVQEYYRQVTLKLMRDFDFDGSKLDYSYSVPRCFNPAHHHKSPDDSVRAVAEVYKIIFDTTRALKPYGVTQICPCGTTPNLAWLPYMDQAVTADPVGSVQVRRRIKLYKAILGPQSAIYGDHVELSGPRSDEYGVQLKNRTDPSVVFGEDFAATVATGGVLGTKFTWPDVSEKLQRVFLTTRKEQDWKKWINLYNAKMLSRGTFLNLYTIGYDSPEGYAISKDGKMYYAFFAPLSSPVWKGELALRGLGPGKYRVFDYENEKDLGETDAGHRRLSVEFREHLLLELARE